MVYVKIKERTQKIYELLKLLDLITNMLVDIHMNSQVVKDNE